MGKGDKRTVKGKINAGSFGKVRPKRKSKLTSEAVKTTKKKAKKTK